MRNDHSLIFGGREGNRPGDIEERVADLVMPPVITFTEKRKNDPGLLYVNMLSCVRERHLAGDGQLLF